MEIQEFEALILSELKKVVEDIIKTTPTLPVKVASGERQGDYISKHLEKAFVEKAGNHNHFINSKTSLLGKTKSPYDIETTFTYKNHNELIWVDFKAINIDNKDSNADSGTYTKVITFIQEGHFYLTYIYVYYQDAGNGNMKFSKNNEGEMVKVYFLKDIGDNMHITPLNQMQVNFQAGTVYRTREEFIDFFITKLKKSYEYRSLDSRDMMAKLDGDEIRLGKYKKPKELKSIKESSKISTKIKVIKPIKRESITFNEFKQLNKEQEEKIKNL